MKKRRIYISGPISGLSSEDYMLNFAAAQVTLEACGYEVVNPTQLAPCRWPWIYRLIARITSEHTAYKLTIVYGLWRMVRCDRIYLIEGWKEGTSARIESFVAWSLGIRRLPIKEREAIDLLLKAETSNTHAAQPNCAAH